MYRRPSKRQELIRRVLIYALMTAVVLVVVAGLVLVVLGYQLSQNGNLEQGALLQFDSIPTGATVSIDNKIVSGQTPSKSSVLAGPHTFQFIRTGYEPWTKTVDIKAGTLTWLNYIRLIPGNRPVDTVTKYSHIFASKASSDGHSIVIQPLASVPSFDLVNLTNDTATTTTVTIPDKAYSDAGQVGVTHTFTMSELDSSGRYLLIQHVYNNQTEWLVMDTQNPDSTVNITSLFNLDITEAHFVGTNGSIVYVLSGGNLQKLDLSASTVSSILVSHVTSFGLYNTNVITYIGTTDDGSQRVVGLYREGDSTPFILRTTSSSVTTPLAVTTTNYFNANYIAISEGGHVDITTGNYPSASDPTSMKPYASFDLDFSPTGLTFSASGDYLLLQSGKSFAGYDIEHQTLTTSTTVGTLSWLDDTHLWSDDNGMLTVRDFDGTNVYPVNKVAVAQDVTLAQSGKYIYSIGQTTSGYQLQRVRLIL